MNNQLQGSNISNPTSTNQEGLKVEFQQGQFPQNKKPIELFYASLFGIGITQMIIGVSCIILNIVQIFLKGTLSFVGYGIWGGVFFFISGLLSLLAGTKDTTKCLIVSTIVMNIISAIVTAPVFILSVMESEMYDSVNQPTISDKLNHSWMGPMIAALAFVEEIISIVCSSLCRNAYCCCFKADENGFIGRGMAQILIGVTCFTLNIVQLVMSITYICMTGNRMWERNLAFFTILTTKTSTDTYLIVYTMFVKIHLTGATVLVLVWGLIGATTYNPDYLNNGKPNITGIGSTIATIAIMETVISIACSALHRNNYRSSSSVIWYIYLEIRDIYLVRTIVR